MQLIRSGSRRSRLNSGLPRPTSAEAGFSLIEVLAALLVTMLLVLTLTPFASQMLATWARGGEAANTVELKTRGLSRLREDLHHAIVLTGYGQTQDLAAFQGDETSMSFPVVAELDPTGMGIEYLYYTVGTSINGRALVRRRAPVIGSTYGSFADPVVLLSGPFRYVFRYYSREGEEAPVWSKSRFDLPGHIELDIADRNGVQLLGIPIAISTFASLSAACFASSNLQGCPSIAKPPIDDEALKALGITLPRG
jgi:general secretion pathway protein J